MVNKDQAFQDWINTYSEKSSYVLFQWLSEQNRSCSIVPIPKPQNRPDILGIAQQEYNFALQSQMRLSTDTDSTNTDNMMVMRLWQDWIMQQEQNGNYPDFGENCSNYKLELVSDIPQLSQKYENGIGKYEFYAKLTYQEIV